MLGGKIVKWSPALTLLALLLILVGCVDTKPTTESGTDPSSQVESGCTLDIDVHISPWEPTIKVGEKLTPTVELLTCGGLKRFTDTYIWTSEDPSVAMVNPTSGLITARAPGQVWLQLKGAMYGNLDAYSVTVIGE